MTIPRLNALEKIWQNSPPAVRTLSFIAQTYGMKVAKKKTEIGLQEFVGLADGT